MVDKVKYVGIHLFITKEQHDRWMAHKEARYNGLRAFSKMIRDFVDEGIAREQAKDKTLHTLEEQVRG